MERLGFLSTTTLKQEHVCAGKATDGADHDGQLARTGRLPKLNACLRRPMFRIGATRAIWLRYGGRT